MTSYKWASPKKAFEYYLDRAGRTHADLWNAVNDGHIRVEIMDTEFSGIQIQALLKLLHLDVPKSAQRLELPMWMAVHMDDVERVLCSEDLPKKRKGRPKNTRTKNNRDYQIACDVSKFLSTGKAASVADAAQMLIDANVIKGASNDAKLKQVQRAYSKYFRTD
jgi:hypothetical protein